MPDTTPNSELATIFLEFSRKRLVLGKWPNLRDCVLSLTSKQLWSRPNQASNSVGNLLLHLNGNISQFLMVPFDRTEDNRNRALEFKEVERPSGMTLLRRLGTTIELADQVLARLTLADLLETYTVPGGQMKGINLIYRVVEHFALHYGQILYATKALTATDLGIYKGPN